MQQNIQQPIANPPPQTEDIEGLDNSCDLGDFPIDSLMIRTETRSVFEVCRRIDSGHYIMVPDFQRDFVWDEDRQSKLVESAVLRIPFPVFYFAETETGKMIVVDGLQRLTTFYRYLKNEFKLKNLQFAKNLNEKKFADLSSVLQNRIEDTPLTLYLIDSKVPEAAKYEIFERVNSGIPLTRQQMRNCLYAGEATRWLKQMAQENDFLRATDNSIDSMKMRDRECINRFAGFYCDGLKTYAGKMDDFLSSTLKKLNNDGVPKELGAVFLKSMRINGAVFGENAFRKSILDENCNRSVINVALFDVLSVEFAKWPEEVVTVRKEKIKNAVCELLRNKEFQDTISSSTNSAKKVKRRFQMTEEYLTPLRT
jgi:hypothetical protein